MKLVEYQEIINFIRMLGFKAGCIQELEKYFPSYSVKTLGSIYSQDYQRKTKKTYYKHYVPGRMEEYYQRYMHDIEQGKKEVLLKLSEEIDMAPSLLARIIIEKHLENTEFHGEPPPKGVVSLYIKNINLIKDPVLAEEVNLCVLADQVYGPIVDIIKHSVGQEYECILKHTLEERGLLYLDENDLRARGYDKTPDVKLEIPIAVNGHVVNWIESKASFGDEESHRTYLKEQFWSYWNRFGPGLVIYWFGFIDELDIHQDKGILLMDHFPDDIVMMNPLSLLPQGLLQHSEKINQCAESITKSGDSNDVT